MNKLINKKTHKFVLFQHKSMKRKVKMHEVYLTLLMHSPYSPDLAPSETNVNFALKDKSVDKKDIEML